MIEISKIFVLVVPVKLELLTNTSPDSILILSSCTCTKDCREEAFFCFQKKKHPWLAKPLQTFTGL